jgi:isoleucyl-tRNA synthetase
MAPILSFTAEEAWGILCLSTLSQTSAQDRVTIFTHTYHSLPSIDNAELLQSRWARLREIRAQVTRKLEDLRTAGGIGSSLQGEVNISASGPDLDLLQSVADSLKFILIVSRASVKQGSGELQIDVVASSHTKCERCWHLTPDVGVDPARPTICKRCVDNLDEGARG